MRRTIAPFLLKEPPREEESSRGGRRGGAFLDRAIRGLSRFVGTAYVQWDLSSRRGLLQGLDPRLKLLFLVGCVVLISIKRGLLGQGLVAGLFLSLAILSRLNLLALYGRVLALGFVFGFLVTIPSSLNVVTPGEMILPLFAPSEEGRILWLPASEGIGLTREGLWGVATVTSRVVNSITATFLVLYTTPFAGIVRGLKLFRVPDAMLMVIWLTYKYLFVLVRIVEEMHLARKARLAVDAGPWETRRWAANRMAMLFRKTQMRCDEIHKGMVARGFSGTIEVRGLGRFTARDWLAAGILVLAAVVFTAV